MAALAITVAQVLPGVGCVIEDITAGEALTQGQPAYKKSTDSDRAYKSDSDAAGEAHGCYGLVLSGMPVAGAVGRIARAGRVTLGAAAAMTVGIVYCCGPNAGEIVPYADLANPSYVTILGVAESASSLVLGINATGIQKP